MFEPVQKRFNQYTLGNLAINRTDLKSLDRQPGKKTPRARDLEFFVLNERVAWVFLYISMFHIYIGFLTYRFIHTVLLTEGKKIEFLS